MHPNILLAYLITAGTIVGAKLYVDHGASGNDEPKSSAEMLELRKEIEILKAENQTLKNIQGVGREITLPLELYTYVEKNLGLEFSPHVKAFNANEDKLSEAAEYRWIQQFGDEGMDKRNYTFQLLGLLPVNQNYSKQLALAESNGAIGIYDVNAKELLLADHYDPQNVFHQASIIRLLSIALLEEHYPAAELMSDDAFIARDAVIRGRSSMVSHRFQNNYARTGHIKTGADAQNLEAIDLFRSLPELVQGITTFPVKNGKGYVEYLILNHDEVFPQLFTTPPSSTAEIFANQLPKVSNSSEILDQSEQKPILQTNLGQAITEFYIQRLESENSQLHTELTTDQLTLSELSTEFKASWVTKWSNQDSAQKFHTIAKEISSSMENPCDVSISENTVTLSQSVAK